MTQAEIEAQWQRYMHRADLSVDMATTWVFARGQIKNRLMRAGVDTLELDAILISDPLLYLHSGMTYLQELAQDDMGLQREMARFGEAINDYQMHHSIENGPATMVLYGGLEAP